MKDTELKTGRNAGRLHIYMNILDGLSDVFMQP